MSEWGLTWLWVLQENKCKAFERETKGFIHSFPQIFYVSWKKRSETKLIDFNRKVTSALLWAEVKNHKFSKSAATTDSPVRETVVLISFHRGALQAHH